MIRDLSDVGIDPVIDRHRRYWNNEGGLEEERPLFRFSQASPMVANPQPHPLELPPRIDPEAYREGIERSYDQHGLLDDDLIRMVGTGITSEVLVGCQVVVRAGTHWAEPAFTDWRQFDQYRVEDNPWFQRVMENTDRALQAVGGECYPFCCMALRGTVDMAQALMTGEQLCAAVVDHPRQLKDLLGRVTDINIAAARAHAELIPRFRGGQFNSYGIWTPGRTMTFTLDGGCLFSPGVYEEFFLPCDQRLCAAFETPFVHLHAASRQHFEAWTEIDNLGLQCVIDQAWLPEGRNLPIGPQLPELLPAFRRMRERKSLMIYGYWDEEWLGLAETELAPGGSALTGMVEEPQAMRGKYLGKAAD